ncbi:MAG: alpha/beta fold hydrolase [Gemmatimonadota bacterium]
MAPTGGADGGLPIHVRLMGPDPGPEVESFILLHGYGGSSFSWRFWAPRLAQRGHVVLVDLKGFGLAPRPRDDAYGPRDHAHLVVRYILERDLANVTLVGHSLGGLVALLAALDLLNGGAAAEPDRMGAQPPSISRLIRLVSVSGAAYPQKLPPFVAVARRRRLSRILFALTPKRLLVRTVLRQIVYDPATVTREQIEGYAAPLRIPGTADALIRTAQQIIPPDAEAFMARYPEIRVPALLLWGREDRVVPPEVGEHLTRELPRARLAVLEECGHLPPEERPDASYSVLEEFLEENPLHRSRANV